MSESNVSESSFESQTAAFSPLKTRNQQLEKRLKSFPVINSFQRSLKREINQHIQAGTLSTELSNLFNGQTNLERSLLHLANTATQILDTALRDTQVTAVKETQANLQYREAVVRQSHQHPRDSSHRSRGSYTLTGQLLHPDTQEPLSGVAVEAIESKNAKPNVLGIDVTDAEGRFEITFRVVDFKKQGEHPPEVLLQAGSDRKTLLPITEQSIVLQPNEVVTINPELSPAVLELLEQRSVPLNTQLHHIDRAIVLDQLQQIQVVEMSQELKDGLNQLADFLKE